jgi:hypothetical protein
MTWIDPNGRAFAFLPPVQVAATKEEDLDHVRQEAERKRQQEELTMKRAEEAQRRQESEQRIREYEERQRRWQYMNKAKEQANSTEIVPQLKAEILPPDTELPSLPPLDMNAVSMPDLTALERDIRDAATNLDLTQSEGWLDALFDRRKHRIEVKTERADLLADYMSACAGIVEAGVKRIEAAGAVQRAKYQLVLERLEAMQKILKVYYGIQLVHRQVVREDEIDAERARTVIEQHRGDAREHSLRGQPSPPLAPAPVPAAPEDPRKKKKAALQQELERLNKEEKEELAKLSNGKPQNEWTEELHEEIKRTVNMYYHARERVREELQKCL